jgi:hypothetical protein
LRLPSFNAAEIGLVDILTDKLKSYAAAKRKILPSAPI